MAYQERIVDDLLASRLGAAGAVVLEGAKACGKTETARQVAASSALFDVEPEVQRLMQVEPQAILAGPTPRLLDEWQLAPLIWNYVRRAVDDRQAPGQFILTGSSVPNDDHTRHSGAGRFSFLRMRPMSLFESGHSSGGVSLALMAGEFRDARTSP